MPAGRPTDYSDEGGKMVDSLFNDLVLCGVAMAEVDAKIERQHEAEIKRLEPVEVFPGLAVK